MSASIVLKGKTTNNPLASPLAAPPTVSPMPNKANSTRMTSDGSSSSAKFYDQGDKFDDYDDFGAGDCRVGGGRGGGKSGKQKRREENRGGSDFGDGNIYSAKHIRTRQSLHRNKEKK